MEIINKEDLNNLRTLREELEPSGEIFKTTVKLIGHFTTPRYYLFGQDLIRAYEDGGITAAADYYHKHGRGMFHIHKPTHSSTTLLDVYTGWQAYIEISPIEAVEYLQRLNELSC